MANASIRYGNGQGGYKLGVDLVGGTILVYEVDQSRKLPDNYKPVLVGTNGDITLPLIGRVKAAGLNTSILPATVNPVIRPEVVNNIELGVKGSFLNQRLEINGDLLEGKRTIVLAHAIGRVNSADRAWIASFLARPRERRLTREVLRLSRILASSGSIEWAQRSAAAFAEAAKREFHDAAFAGVPASPDLEWLRACADFIVQRKA